MPCEASYPKSALQWVAPSHPSHSRPTRPTPSPIAPATHRRVSPGACVARLYVVCHVCVVCLTFLLLEGGGPLTEEDEDGGWAGAGGGTGGAKSCSDALIARRSDMSQSVSACVPVLPPCCLAFPCHWAPSLPVLTPQAARTRSRRHTHKPTDGARRWNVRDSCATTQQPHTAIRYPMSHVR